MSEPAVARAFSRAASSYDQHARVQQSVGRSLVAMIDDDVPIGLAVDLGCGTAPLARQLVARMPDRRWLALDLAPGMLREARTRGRLDGWWAACADIDALPLGSGSAALVWSSFALQWADSPANALDEVGRVLVAGGQAVLAMPVAGSLRELKEAWAAVDDARHVNELASDRDWLGAIPRGVAVRHSQLLAFTEHYPDLAAIHHMLKGSGAHHVRGGSTALTGPGRLRTLTRAYEARRQAEGLPLSWQVLFLVLEKLPCAVRRGHR